MASVLLSPFNPRRSALGSISSSEISSRNNTPKASSQKDKPLRAAAMSASKPGGRSIKEWALILGTSSSSSSSVKKQAKPEEKAFSGEFFGRRGLFSSKRGPTPSLVTAFGISGILEDVPGKPPQTIEVMGEAGVLEDTRGPTPAGVLAAQAEERARTAKSERDALAIADFLERHADAKLLAGGKVQCTTTGHEMPLDLYWLSSHWEGKKYAKAVKAAKRADEDAARPPKRSKAEKKKASRERLQAEAAHSAAQAANFPTDGSTRWTTTAVRGPSSAQQLPVDPLLDPERWTMADVAKIGDARKALLGVARKIEKGAAAAAAAAAAAKSAKSAKGTTPRKLPRPPPGYPPLEVSTPDVAAQLADEVRAERMRAEMATPDGAGAAVAAEPKRFLVRMPMANKKASVLTSMAMQDTEEPEEGEASASARGDFPCVRASYAPKPMASDWARLFKAKPADQAEASESVPETATATATATPVDVTDAEAPDRGDFPCVRASYAPKPMTSDWARLFKAKPANQAAASESVPAPVPVLEPVLEPPGTPTAAAPTRAQLPAKTPPPPSPLPAKEFSVKDVKAMKVVELRSALYARGLSTDGLKPALTARLLESLASGALAVEAEAAPVAADAEEESALRDSVKNIIAQAVAASPSAPASRSVRASARGKENQR